MSIARTQAETQPSLPAALRSLVYDVMSVPDAELPAAIQRISDVMAAIEFTDEAHLGDLVLPDHAIHDVRVNPTLYQWSKLPQILLRFGRQSFAEVLDSYHAEPDRLTFQSGAALLDAAVMGAPFYAPLLGNASPSMWGFGVPRINQTTIVTFGRLSAGLGAGPSRDLLDLLSHLETRTEPSTMPGPQVMRERYDGIHRAAYAAAIDWWTQQMNETIHVIYAPTTYVDADGVYLPAEHHRWMLNFEQLLSRVAAVARQGRDPSAQLLLMFSAMDLLGDAFIGGGVDGLFAPNALERAIATVVDHVPERARPVLMLPTERALTASRAIADEFFLPPRDPTIAPARRITKLMTARRNATHGFWTDDDELVEHSGHLPVDLALVPYTYLLKFVTQTGREGLFNKIRRECRRPRQPARGRRG
ncbi:hypothetical protein SAMN04489765_0104 [Tsukamurella pulmonis]|uniref:Uncharacterized protein n=1 Tax=Tsukamurella pulmonis TaxID=47312 RepID=A0A1H1A8C4_9ACTN|nr:hypothetical protein SAMN04489765_0104 [Tsukamurella pulmonis]SUQ39433.1 Uncharacterised protein [Tsukamurella pulmonis]